AGSLWLYRRAAQERDRANRETAIAAAVGRFLGNDLIGRTDPFQSGRSEETLEAAVKLAAPNIDRQFHDAPEVAALFRAAGGELSQDAIVTDLQRAAMEARAYQTGTLPEAKARLAAAEKLLG